MAGIYGGVPGVNLEENGQTTLLEQLVCTGSRAPTTAAMHNNEPERLETLATPVELSNHHTTTKPTPTANTQPHSNNTDDQPSTSRPEPIGPRELLRAAHSDETLFLHLEHPTTGETTLTATVIRATLQQEEITLTDPNSAGQRFTIVFEGDTAELYRTRTPTLSNADYEANKTTTPKTHVGTIVAVHNLASYSR